MIIYIITFLLSLLFINFGYSLVNSKRITRILCFCIGIILPCVLAACRDVSIGTDTSGYIVRLFDLSLRTNGFFDFCSLSRAYFDISDYAYLFLTYFSSKTFGNFKWLLFFIELSIILPIFSSLAIIKKDKKDVLLGMFIFYFFIYNVTFNMARQSIAIAFSILGFTFISKNKKIFSIICLLLSILSHNTAFFVIFLYLGYYFIKSKQFDSIKGIILFIVYLISILLVFQYKSIISFLFTHGIYEHGMLYIERFSIFDFSYTDTIIYLFMLSMIVFNKSVLIKKNIDYDFYLFLAIEGLILLQVGAFIQYMERLSLFLLYPLLINGISMIGIDKGKISKNTFVLIVVLVLYWIYTFGILNSHNTVPYIFG